MTGAGLLWVDASAGVAGDMLLGALVDAGVALADLQSAVDAVVPGSVRLTSRTVERAGLRATKVDVEVLVDDPPHRTWATIRTTLEASALPAAVRDRALAVFGRLADAEGRVHGVPPEEVHFHEVGALDAVADVVGTCAGVVALGADDVVVSPVALGFGTVRAHHGTLPVPVPAVLELARGWDVVAGGEGELATPTGLALVTALASRSGPLPAVRVDRSGVGAGTRDVPGRANVVRIVLGTPTASRVAPAGRAGSLGRAGAPDPADPAAEGGPHDAVVVEANVDDLDPRVWPDVLAALLAAGAQDAWLTPVLMKKGRPGHTVHALTPPSAEAAVGAVLARHTTTLGWRVTPVTKETLARTWVQVVTEHGPVPVKVGHADGVVVQAQPEYDDVRRVAGDVGVPVREVLAAAQAAARAAGLVPGAPAPGA